MKLIKKYFLFVILVIILIVVIVININNESVESLEENEVVENELVISDIEIEENIEEKEEIIVLYKVDIKGAVLNPGVYEIEKGMRVIDAINKAGGLLYYANTSTINLSKFVSDEMVIYVYTNDEIAKLKEDKKVIEYIEKECDCPKIENDACINIDDDKKEENALVNINTASLDELMTIPKIGEAKAKDIIKYRDEVGSFKSIEDIKNINGIKDAIYEAIKDYITV